MAKREGENSVISAGREERSGLRNWGRKSLLSMVLIAVFSTAVAAALPHKPSPPYVAPLPKITFLQGTDNPEDVTLALKFLFLLTFFAVAPSFVLMTTCYTRIVIILSFVRRAMGTQDLPPTQVTLALALFLSFFVMAPTIKEIKEKAWDPYQAKQITTVEAYEAAIGPVRRFMLKETRPKDLALFIRMSGLPRPRNVDDVPTYIIVPSFIVSELTTAFLMGVYIFLPFLVIDMVVASTLMSMGMIMLPPVMISLPFKILLFVLVDGWNLIALSAVKSFG
ncbi:MAG: flagellar biosynthetic protein FliP [Candidatus Hydrogenedentota bacterium]|nr:MAG: flagellar biosynthetic protein FliP [Candidatus Hydrogenedentota bacterium]